MRIAGKAGTWYSDKADSLSDSFRMWMVECKPEMQSGKNLKALIVPHAGYSYSGKTASSAYCLLAQAVEQGDCDHVLLLHPSHYSHLTNLKQTPFDTLQTPLGTLKVQKINNIEVNSELIDLREHSGELQYPFLAYCKVPTVTSIMVGSQWTRKEQEVLEQYIHGHPKTIVVISTDFCHFGEAFDYCPKTITSSQDIEEMDLNGLKAIGSFDPNQFTHYLNQTQNTICGRHPLLLTMHIFQALKYAPNHAWTLLKYSQSRTIRSRSEESVSYLSAMLHEL